MLASERMQGGPGLFWFCILLLFVCSDMIGDSEKDFIMVKKKNSKVRGTENVDGRISLAGI